MIPFRKKRTGPVLSHDQGLRQGRVVRSAQAALHGTEAVRAFLNSHHAGLRGRPLDLAVASEAGLLAVEAVMAGYPPNRPCASRSGVAAASRRESGTDA